MYLLHGADLPSDATRYLEKAAAGRKDNALIWYSLAERRFHMMESLEGEAKARMRDLALTDMETGNQAARYTCIPLVLPAPAMLKGGWDLARVYAILDYPAMAENLGCLRDMIRPTESTDSAADPELAMHAAYIEFGYGVKLVEAMAGEDLDVRNPRFRSLRGIRKDLGVVFCIGGYQSVEKLNKRFPDTKNDQFLQRYASVIEKVRALEKEFRINLWAD